MKTYKQLLLHTEHKSMLFFDNRNTAIESNIWNDINNQLWVPLFRGLGVPIKDNLKYILGDFDEEV